ncbi:MAG TPA: zinc metallopeptidase [Saprospiraceae bacterium]|nr:zinc metallopeptidase [Saprospiraceae bacterium]
MIIGLVIISILFGVVGYILSYRLKSKFKRYSEVPLSNGMSGKDVAESMLKSNGIYDVQVTSVEGELTDHYNPENRTVNLSQDVYSGRNVAAAAVAAHECGHAVQHATAYSMLALRTKLVPVVTLSASLQQYLFMFGFIGLATLNNKYILLFAIAAFGVTALFSIITLPVEIDASKRALVWLQSSNIATGVQYDGARDALKWAAYTYVAAALAAITQLLYLVLLYMGRRD